VTVHLLGIRHHGPGSARSVLAALERLQPDVLLVEVPADVQPLLSWIGHPELVPPVSLLGYVVAKPASAAFAPFAVFSPEWQTIAWGNERDIEVSAIDLPLSVTMAGAGGEEGEMIVETAPPDPIRDLSAAAGDSDPERWWEDVIEHRGDEASVLVNSGRRHVGNSSRERGRDGQPDAFAAVAEAMVAARSGFVPSLRESQREAHMRRAIRKAIRDGHETIGVVCGAWHVPALDLTDRTATADTRELRGLPKVKVAAAWVPWTHRRLTTASGYGAGVESPGWYRHVFEHPGSVGVSRFFVDAARVLRESGGAASPDDLIAGTRLADSLAAMRGRPRAGLSEVLDAADAVMGGLDLVHRELVIGDALGTVPASAPQVPLARDLAKAQRSARLAPSADSRAVEVDLRKPTGLRKSHLLHRLLALGVPWGSPIEGRGSSGTFRETWQVAWEPELSIRLIECSGYGTTVESAATARLVERASAATSIVELVGVLELALFAGLPAAIEPGVRHLAQRAATDPDVGQLMDAVVPLATALRYGDVRGTNAASLRTVFDGMVVRILAGVVPACRSLDDDSAAVMVERLTGLQAALAMLDHDARHRGLPGVLKEVASCGSGSGGHGLVQGRAARLLHDSGDWTPIEVERRLSQALSGGTAPAAGAAFIEGFVAGSGAVLVHDADLLGVLDRWLSSLTGDSFDAVIVLLRRTFGAFEPAERRQVMAMVMGFGTERSTGFGSDVDPARAHAALVTVRRLLGLADGGDLLASAATSGSADQVAAV
jgi:hypothetical protein